MNIKPKPDLTNVGLRVWARFTHFCILFTLLIEITEHFFWARRHEPQYRKPNFM